MDADRALARGAAEMGQHGLPLSIGVELEQLQGVIVLRRHQHAAPTVEKGEVAGLPTVC